MYKNVRLLYLLLRCIDDIIRETYRKIFNKKLPRNFVT